MPTLKLYLLGSPRIEYAGQPIALTSQKAMALLFYVALEAQAPISRGKLATMFWEDSDERHARRSLNDALYKLRQALPGSNHIIATWEWVQLSDSSDYWVDVEEFEHALEGISTAPDALSINRAVRVIELYREGFLDGFILKENEAFSVWTRFRREALHLAYISLLEQLAYYHQQRHNYGQAIKYSLDALRADPLQESAYCTLMRLYHREGNRAAALRTYEKCREVLELELGTAPSDETQEIHALLMGESILKQEQLPEWKTSFLLGEERLPLVDRDLELNLLNNSLDAVIRGQARVLLVEGEAGIGKTRLIEEFLARQTTRRIAVLAGHCYPMESPLPYQAFIPILRAVLSLWESISPSDSGYRWMDLRKYLSGWGKSVARMTEGSENRLRQLAPLLTAILREITQRRPATLFLDDCQWSDAASSDLLAYLVHSLRDERILFIVAYRAEELSPPAEAVLHNLEVKSQAKHLTLSRLNADQTGQLVRHITKGIGGHVLERRIHRRSEGNPLFTIELTRSLFLRPSTAPTEKRIPNSIRELFQTRLRRLDPFTREFLLTAAVAGERCDFVTVQRASGLDQTEALRALDALLRLRFLQETMAGKFRFAHKEVRQVAMEEISVTHEEQLRLRVAKVQPANYRERLKRASFHLRTQFRRYQRQRELVARGVRGILRLTASIIFLSLVAFFTLRIIPGGPFDSLKHLSSVTIGAIEKYYRVGSSPAEQYLVYLRNVVFHFDLGPSYIPPERTVNDILCQHLPASLGLGLAATLFAIGLGVSCGALAAHKTDSFWDYLFTGMATFGLAIPVIVLGPLLLWSLSFTTAWLPPTGWGELRHLILPSAALGLGFAALIAQSVRDSMVKLQCRLFTDMAMPQRQHAHRLLLWRTLRMSLLSLLPLARSMSSAMMASSLVVEQLFDIPGMGQYLVSTIQAKDYPVLVNTLLFYAILLATVDLLAEIVLALLKPGISRAAPKTQAH
ncbi:MAG: AAA family ATPase [Anaerolineae bacterium]|nr:AAA family ATPase [Anaerolineae bacterium]